MWKEDRNDVVKREGQREMRMDTAMKGRGETGRQLKTEIHVDPNNENVNENQDNQPMPNPAGT